MTLRGVICLAASLLPAASVAGAVASVDGTLAQVGASESGRYGGCLALLDISLSDLSIDCPRNWVTFDCDAATASGGGQRMYRLLGEALAAGKPVALTVTDEGKRNGYCRATRIAVQDSPFVDVDSDGDGVADLDDDVPLNALETQDSDDDGIGNNTDADDDNDGVPDGDDAFPTDPDEWQDTDRDGIGNNADPDDDGDGVFDAVDPFPVGNVAIRLHHGNDGPVGVTAAAGKLFVLDHWDKHVYAYNLDGEPDPTSGFDLEPEQRDDFSGDITHASGHLYVLYAGLSIVRAYTLAGERVPTRDFTAPRSNGVPWSLDYNDGLFRVVQFQNEGSGIFRLHVRAYTEHGDHAPEHDFELDPARQDAGPIAHRAGAVYVIDNRTRKANAYSQTGERQPRYDFDVGRDDVHGFTYFGDRFYVAYRRQQMIRVHESDGRPLPDHDFATRSGTNDDPAGLAYFDGRFYVADWNERKVFVYSTAGEYLPEHNFEIAGAEAQRATTMNGTILIGAGPGWVHAYDPTGARVLGKDLRIEGGRRAAGIEFALGRIYIGDDLSDRVAAYTPGGERLPRHDFNLPASFGGHRGIAYGNSRFHVGHWYRKEIFAFDAFGRELREHGFDLGAAFHGRAGVSDIAFADGAVYVLEPRGDVILPYPIE